MEGMPRLPMIACEPKFSTGSTDFGPKIKEYILKHYEENPENYDGAVTELNALRESACRALADSESACDVLRRYYCQLLMLKNRFPMEQNDESSVPFTWLDKCFEMPNPVVFEDINYELACIMHNMGALHSQLAANETRLSLEGIKVAFSHFQCAAWTFVQLRDHMSAAAFSIDFDKAILSFLSNVMLAQAQECVLEKSLIDHRKHTIIAKIAVQTADLFHQCLKAVESSHVGDLVGGSRWKEWKRLCQMKERLYISVAYLYMGQQADEEKHMGERLSWYNAALQMFKDATKMGEKDKREQVKTALQFANDVINGKQQNAQKENDFIYHDKVPDIDSLPELKGVALVKPVGFDPMDPKVSGADLFGSLVPLTVLSSCSVYSEEKAKLLRSVAERVENKNSDLAAFKQSLNLDELSLSDSDANHLPVPEALLERSAALNAQPDAVPRLLDSLQRLTGCYQEAEGKLSDLGQRLMLTQRQLRDFDKKDNNVAESVRSLEESLQQIGDDVEQYREVHAKATVSNKDLQNAVAVHSENLKLLAMPLGQLKKHLPAPPAEASTSTEGLELKRIIEKVKEMETQRTTLMEQLRTHFHDDDLTKQLMAHKDTDPTDLFEKELRKHDKHIGLIDQNLAAQTNILQALTDANAKYAQRRRETVDASKARNDKVMALVAAFEVYSDVSAKSEQGRVFYQHYLEKLRLLEDKLDECEAETAVLLKKEQEHKEKLAAEVAARQRMREEAVAPLPPVQPTATPAAPTRHDKGPRLGDYLDYYRAKKGLPAQPGVGPAPVSMLNFPPMSAPSVAPMPPAAELYGQEIHSVPYSASAQFNNSGNPVIPVNYSASNQFHIAHSVAQSQLPAAPLTQMSQVPFPIPPASMSMDSPIVNPASSVANAQTQQPYIQQQTAPTSFVSQGPATSGVYMPATGGQSSVPYQVMRPSSAQSSQIGANIPTTHMMGQTTVTQTNGYGGVMSQRGSALVPDGSGTPVQQQQGQLLQNHIIQARQQPQNQMHQGPQNQIHQTNQQPQNSMHQIRQQPQNQMHQGPQPQNPMHQGPQHHNQIHQTNQQPQNPMHQSPQPQNPMHQGPQHHNRIHQTNQQPQNPMHQGPQPQNQMHQGPQPQNQMHQGPQPQNQVHQGPQPQNQVHQGPQPQNQVHQTTVTQTNGYGSASGQGISWAQSSVPSPFTGAKSPWHLQSQSQAPAVSSPSVVVSQNSPAGSMANAQTQQPYIQQQTAPTTFVSQGPATTGGYVSTADGQSSAPPYQVIVAPASGQGKSGAQSCVPSPFTGGKSPWHLQSQSQAPVVSSPPVLVSQNSPWHLGLQPTVQQPQPMAGQNASLMDFDAPLHNDALPLPLQPNVVPQATHQ